MKSPQLFVATLVTEQIFATAEGVLQRLHAGLEAEVWQQTVDEILRQKNSRVDAALAQQEVNPVYNMSRFRAYCRNLLNSSQQFVVVDVDTETVCLVDGDTQGVVFLKSSIFV